MFYNIYEDSLADAKLEVNGQSFQMDKDFNASINNVDAIMRFSEIVFVGANAIDSLKNANLAGKAVMVLVVFTSLWTWCTGRRILWNVSS